MRLSLFPARLTRALAAAAALTAAAPSVPSARADTPPPALARPGATAIMRHALAPGGGDPENFVLGDCSTQRNLDERGRAQARAIGAALRAQEMTFDLVLTSRWCRCRETAELLDVGPVEALPALDSFWSARHRADAQTEAVRAYLADLPQGTRVMMVTHYINIVSLTGDAPASGEVLALERGEGGEVSVIGAWLVDP